MDESSKVLIFSPVPLMHKEKFSELVGVSYGVVDGWCNRGYISTMVIGKHQLVNMAALTQECLDQLPR